MDTILTVDDVARILKVKPITVREMFREKRLRAFKVGKGWRTTEQMLSEDLAALSRGEKPEALPSPQEDAPKPPRAKRNAPSPTPAPADAAPVQSVPPAASNGHHGASAAGASSAAPLDAGACETAAMDVPNPEGPPDDDPKSQQLLF